MEPLNEEADFAGKYDAIKAPFRWRHVASAPVLTAVHFALETEVIQVESVLATGYAGVQMIGNTNEVCRDGRERARAALERCGIELPAQRIVVSLTPADIRKDGNQFDLPMAMSLWQLTLRRPVAKDFSRWLFASELGLDGSLRPVRGTVSFAIKALAMGFEGVVVARENLPEVQALMRLRSANGGPLQVCGFRHLKEVMAWAMGSTRESTKDSTPNSTPKNPGSTKGAVSPSSDCDAAQDGLDSYVPNFDDMILTEAEKEVAVVVAAGGHSLFLKGPPGTGKSMFAARLPSLLPKMHAKTHREALEIHSSVSGAVSDALLAGRASFRSPHHSASAQALLGHFEQPGELSLAHGGVLFLDEFPEFRRDLLESLREPLESHAISLSRVRHRVTWKAKVLLVAAANQCPCGWWGSSRGMCRCPPPKREAYQNRLSGPILERIDMHVSMRETNAPAADFFLELAPASPSPGTNVSNSQLSGPKRQAGVTKELAARVLAARRFGESRNRQFGVVENRDLPAGALWKSSGLSPQEFAKLVNEVLDPDTSHRASIRTIRVARTLADLDQREALCSVDLKKAWNWQAQAEDRGHKGVPRKKLIAEK